MRGPDRTPQHVGGVLLVDGSFNVRDVGGCPTLGGARVAPGRLLRSATLDAITDQGVETLRAFGLRTVFDLRSATEVERYGRFPVDRLPVRWEHLTSTVSPPTPGNPGGTQFLDHPDPMEPMYLEILSSSGAEFARGLRILSDGANHPAIVHCTSGKDRTGMFVVLLHLVLGVSLNDALAHYVQDRLTTERAAIDMTARYPELAALPPEKMMRMAGTNVRWVAGALASIGGEHAVPDWLASHGCDHHAQARLRTAFTKV